MIDAVESFRHDQIFAMWTTGFIEPGSFIRAVRLHDKRVVVFPLTHGVTEPPGFRMFFLEFSPVGPDDAPDFVEFVQDYYRHWSLKNLSRSQFIKVLAGQALGFTGDDLRIIDLRRMNHSGAISRLME